MKKSTLGFMDEWNTWWFGYEQWSFWRCQRKVCWDSWMNGIPDFVWSIKFLMMEKSTFGIYGWMKYMASFGQWSLLMRMKKSKLESDEWIASLIWTMNEVLLSTKKITLGFMNEWNTWFGLDNEVLDDVNVGTHGWMKYLAWFEQWSLDDDDDDEKYVRIHGWMNTRLVLQAWFGQWSLSRMKKSMLGVIDEWKTWLDLDNEVFWWGWKK